MTGWGGAIETGVSSLLSGLCVMTAPCPAVRSSLSHFHNELMSPILEPCELCLRPGCYHFPSEGHLGRAKLLVSTLTLEQGTFLFNFFELTVQWIRSNLV